MAEELADEAVELGLLELRHPAAVIDDAAGSRLSIRRRRVRQRFYGILKRCIMHESPCSLPPSRALVVSR